MLFSKEEGIGAVFQQILKDPDACTRLKDTFFQDVEEYQEMYDCNANDTLLAKIMFAAYNHEDINALLIGLCGRNMIELLRQAYLMPQVFHGKAGKNPILLTDCKGQLLRSQDEALMKNEYARFQEILKNHHDHSHAELYLAEAYDLIHTYEKDHTISFQKINRRRGLLSLFTLPNSHQMGLSLHTTYELVWQAFMQLQKLVPFSLVFYGQESQTLEDHIYDEIGILLSVHQPLQMTLDLLKEIEKIILSCKEQLIKQAGKDEIVSKRKNS